MSHNRVVFTHLTDADLLKSVGGLQTKGWIEQTDEYCYLNIDDGFVHSAFPQLAAFGDGIQKPDYFHASDAIGAHISVIYPEEHVELLRENMGQIHHFQLGRLIKAQYDVSTYFILSVISPSLNCLRQMHHLAVQPTFKGQQIMFHITIGVRHQDETMI